MIHKHAEPSVTKDIILMCPECSAERKAKFQKDMVRDPAYYLGKFVKIAFEDENGTEHMWVKVFGLAGDDLLGSLDNIPITVNMALGDPVQVSLDEIEDVYETRS